jgi:hypothetical protein
MGYLSWLDATSKISWFFVFGGTNVGADSPWY